MYLAGNLLSFHPCVWKRNRLDCCLDSSWTNLVSIYVFTIHSLCDCQFFHLWVGIWVGFAGGSEVKASACNVGDPGSIPGSGRSPGEGNGNPLQYSCLKNPMIRGAWQATVHGITRVRHDLATKPPSPPHDRSHQLPVKQHSLVLRELCWLL